MNTQTQIETLKKELEKTQEKLQANETKLNKIIDMILKLVDGLNEKPSRYNIGDKVVVTDEHHGHELEIDSICTIVGKYGYDWILRDANGEMDCLSTDEFEPFKNEE